MKRKLPYTLGIIVLVMMGLVTSQAKAEKAKVYTIPSWTQTLSAGTRFIVLINMDSDAVLDKETGLVWQQSPSTGPLSWFFAQLQCNNLAVGNRKGWRMPTVQELASLVDPTQSNPALPAGHPFSNVQSSLYWSAATSVADASVAWVVDFGNGDVKLDNKSLFNGFWCVRGGQGVDPQ